MPLHYLPIFNFCFVGVKNKFSTAIQRSGMYWDEYLECHFREPDPFIPVSVAYQKRWIQQDIDTDSNIQTHNGVETQRVLHIYSVLNP